MRYKRYLLHKVPYPHLILPPDDGVEGCPVGGGEGDDAGLRPAVVGLGDGVKLLLARRVP